MTTQHNRPGKQTQWVDLYQLVQVYVGAELTDYEIVHRVTRQRVAAFYPHEYDVAMQTLAKLNKAEYDKTMLALRNSVDDRNKQQG